MARLRYKIINKYTNQMEREFFKLEDAQEYLSRNQIIGKIGLLKGKEILKIRIIDLDKQSMYSQINRNRKSFRKEMFGI